MLSVLCSLPHWGREMKKGFNLKWESRSRKMNKHTCLCAVAQQEEGKTLRLSTCLVLMVLVCAAVLREGWVGLIHGITIIGKWGKKETGCSWVGSHGEYLFFYAPVTWQLILILLLPPASSCTQGLSFNLCSKAFVLDKRACELFLSGYGFFQLCLFVDGSGGVI